MMQKVKEVVLPGEFFFQNKKNILFLVLGMIINLTSWVYLYIKIKPQEEPIYLHYNIYFGVDLIGQWYQIFFIPLTGLIIYFINLYFSYIIYKKEKIISYVIIGTTIFIQSILLITSLLVVRLNI